jgi:hypothetical protein
MMMSKNELANSSGLRLCSARFGQWFRDRPQYLLNRSDEVCVILDN